MSGRHGRFTDLEYLSRATFKVVGATSEGQNFTFSLLSIQLAGNVGIGATGPHVACYHGYLVVYHCRRRGHFHWPPVWSDNVLTSSITLLDVQDLAGIQLHLHFSISLVFAEPAVAREHVLHAVDRDQDLHAVQEPSSSQPLVSVANQKTTDL